MPEPGLRVEAPAVEDTTALAAALAPLLRGDETIHLLGGLGAGKTAFVQGLAAGLGLAPDGGVVSPTFTLINVYEGSVPLAHVDLYRLESPRELTELGLEEYFGEMVTAIEWADRLPPEYHLADVVVRIEPGGGGRRLDFEARNRNAEALLERFRASLARTAGSAG